MVAALTPVPVIGVPVRGSSLDGLDSILSIVQVLFTGFKFQILYSFISFPCWFSGMPLCILLFTQFAAFSILVGLKFPINFHMIHHFYSLYFVPYI